MVALVVALVAGLTVPAAPAQASSAPAALAQAAPAQAAPAPSPVVPTTASEAVPRAPGLPTLGSPAPRGSTRPAGTQPAIDGALALTTADPVVGQSISFHYTTTAAEVDPRNWVAVYDDPTKGPVGQVYGGGGSTMYQYVTNADGTVTFDTSTLTPGTKAAYFLAKDGYTWLAAPVAFTLAPSAAAPPITPTDDGVLTVTTAHPTVDSRITLHYRTDTPDPLNWVALYEDPNGGPVDQVYGGTGSTVYQYVSPASGDVTISTSNLTVGTHIAYFLYQDEYRWLARPVTFTLAAAPPPPPPPHFVTDDFTGTPVPTGGAFTQKLAGLWIDTTGGTTSFAKIAGDSWLTVSSDGIVTGTAPAAVGAHPALITVQATDTAGHTGQIIVEAQVYRSAAPGTVKTASWNLWEAGTHVDSAIEKDLAIILTNDLDVIGVQESGGTVAATLARDLGWYSYQSSGDLGILSRYPISAPTAPTPSIPAAAVTITAGAQPIRVWTSHLDETAYGPEKACAGAFTATQLAAAEATRLMQAKAVLSAMTADLKDTATVPVVLLADLESPSQLDWTAATRATHCGYGPVAWPVTGAITRAGLQDTYRVAQPDPSADPGNTWSPVVLDGAAGQAEPQDRIDYVDEAGELLTVSESHALVTGFPAPVPDTAGNSWTSDHAAAVTTFAIRTAKTATATALRVSAARQVFGSAHPVTITAKVTAFGGAAVSGKVEFRSGQMVLATVGTKNGVALYTTSRYLPAGPATLTAHFTGSTTLAASTSAPRKLLVAMAPTALLLLASARSQRVGTSRPVVLSASVLTPGRQSFAGTVRFRVNGAEVASPRLGNGTARYVLPRTSPAGTYRIAATFAPTDRADVSSSSSCTVTVTVTH